MIMYLIGTSLGVVGYLNKVVLLIIAVHAMLVILLKGHSILCLPNKYNSGSLKWWRIFSLLLFPGDKVITARSWFDSARENCS